MSGRSLAKAFGTGSSDRQNWQIGEVKANETSLLLVENVLGRISVVTVLTNLDSLFSGMTLEFTNFFAD